MNKKQLKEREDIWFILYMTLLCWVIVLCFSSNHSYNKGFQDGQANCTEIKNINMTNITYTQWNTLEDRVEIQGLICSEGYILKVITKDRVGCVTK